MQMTRLLQRLNKPKNPATAIVPGVKAHHVFGGAMTGLTQKQWDVLDPIFEINYMGAAEYEFGTIPMVLGKLMEDREKLEARCFRVPGKSIGHCMDRERRDRNTRRKILADAKSKGVRPPRKKSTYETPPSAKDAFIVCRAEHLDEMERRFRQFIKANEYQDTDYRGEKFTMRTKGHPFIVEAFDTDMGISSSSRTVGWLELNNGAFWFADPEMFRGVCNLFGLLEGE